MINESIDAQLKKVQGSLNPSDAGPKVAKG
jgi:hypothetical protein